MQESSNIDTPAAPTAGPWAMVPIWVLDPDQYLPAVDPATLKDGDDKPLNGTDMRVYVALRSFAGPDGRCWPTTRTVAERANVGKSTAEKAISKMRRIGLLTSHVRHRPDGSISGCVYRLRNDPPTGEPGSGAPSDPEGDTLESEGGVPPDSRGGTSESEGGVPADSMGGTRESKGAGTDQGTHQGTHHPSLCPPSPSLGTDAATKTRETGGRKSLDEQARAEGWRLVHDVRGYPPADAEHLVGELTRRHRIISPQWWRTAHGNGSLDDRIDEVNAERQAGHVPAGTVRPARQRGGYQPFQNEIRDEDYAAYAAGLHREPAA